ncbi:MAG: hypothetical protein ACI3ZN_01690 [Candidatus Cryptobacteroides sp.]
MKRSTILCIVLMALTLSGCDFFRKIAGRPTSAQLEEKKLEIKAKEAEIAAMNAELARIEAEKRRVADSLAYMDSIVLSVREVAFASRHKGYADASQEGFTYVVIGTFKQKTNAELLKKKAEDSGYDANIIRFRNDKISVGIMLPDDPKKAYGILLALKGEDFCPADIWLLIPQSRDSENDDAMNQDSENL